MHSDSVFGNYLISALIFDSIASVINHIGTFVYFTQLLPPGGAFWLKWQGNKLD